MPKVKNLALIHLLPDFLNPINPITMRFLKGKWVSSVDLRDPSFLADSRVECRQTTKHSMQPKSSQSEGAMPTPESLEV